MCSYWYTKTLKYVVSHVTILNNMKTLAITECEQTFVF